MKNVYLNNLSTPRMIVDAVNMYIQDGQPNSVIFGELLELPDCVLLKVLETMTGSTLKMLVADGTTAQIKKLKYVLDPPDHDDLIRDAMMDKIDFTVEEFDDPSIPENVLERIDNDEVFIDIIQEMMYSAGDVKSPLLSSCIVIKDAIGDWYRSCLGPIPTCKLNLNTISALFPGQFVAFNKWYISKSCAPDDFEDEEIYTKPVNPIPDTIQEDIQDIEIPQLGVYIGPISRLELQDRKSKFMTKSEYEKFASCRKSSLIANTNKLPFLTWIGISRRKASTLPSILSKFLSYVAWDRISSYVQVALSLRSKRYDAMNSHNSALRYTECRHAIGITDAFAPAYTPYIPSTTGKHVKKPKLQ